MKLLTDKQFAQMNEKYIITHDDQYITVTCKDYHRYTKHPIDHPFHINAKGIRKITFSEEAIDIWLILEKRGKPTLIEVQQAVNMLRIAYQNVDVDAVKKVLVRRNVKILEQDL